MINKEKGYEEVSRTGKMFDYTYFILHNLISLIIFFWLSQEMNLFDRRTDTITDIFTKEHLNLILIIMAISLISSIFGRLLSYGVLWSVYSISDKNNKHKKVIKSFGNVNRGINKIDFAYFVSMFISSLLYSVGAILILREVLFSDRDSFIFLVLSYFILKSVTEFIVYYKLR